MFDIGWTEMALIAVVAVVVIGPKELPKVMRELGTWVARARGMSRVFMEQLDEMSRQAGIDEVRKEAEALRKLNPIREIEKTVDPEGIIKRQAEDLAQIGGQIEPQLPKPASPTPTGEGASPPATPPAEPPVPQTAGPTVTTPPVGTPREPEETKP